MKKQLFLLWLLVLCLAAGVLPAAAEGAGPIVTDFEDFVLRTNAAMRLQGRKEDGQPVFLFYPYAEGNISMAAVNAVWNPDTVQPAPEEFTRMHREAEAAIRYQYEAGGRSLKSYECGEAEERELWGRPALLCDAVLLVEINGNEVQLYQRGIRLSGPFGSYTFSLSAWSPDLLEEATDYLVRALEWK